MLTITENAASHLHEIADQEHRGLAIRVAVMGGGSSCGLGLVTDEIKNSDITSRHGDYTVAVDGKLLEYCRTITIDFSEGEPEGCSSRAKRGFLISAEKPVVF